MHENIIRAVNGTKDNNKKSGVKTIQDERIKQKGPISFQIMW